MRPQAAWPTRCPGVLHPGVGGGLTPPGEGIHADGRGTVPLYGTHGETRLFHAPASAISAAWGLYPEQAPETVSTSWGWPHLVRRRGLDPRTARAEGPHAALYRDSVIFHRVCVWQKCVCVSNVHRHAVRSGDPLVTVPEDPATSSTTNRRLPDLRAATSRPPCGQRRRTALPADERCRAQRLAGSSSLPPPHRVAPWGSSTRLLRCRSLRSRPPRRRRRDLRY